MTRRQKSERTQWTAQFLAAAELCRRGYVVTFTTGNHTQNYDLIVGSHAPGMAPFYVDVKGLSSNNPWPISKKEKSDRLFYVLVRIHESDRSQDRFSIMAQDDVNREIEMYFSIHKKSDSERNTKTQWLSFKQGTKEEYENNWGKLPQPKN